MSADDFDEILAMVSETIRKQVANMRDPISPGERLAVTLRFLAAGGSMKSVAESFRIGYVMPLSEKSSQRYVRPFGLN